MRKLTVLITTYNRKKPLIEQLKSLESQGRFNEYNIIISDNHSDYDVEEWVKSQLSQDFLSIITVVSRPYNIGSDLNITMGFQSVKTEWMWLLSDDDITQPNSLSTVLKDIENFSSTEIGWIKYSIAGSFIKNQECVLNDIVEVFGYYSFGEVGAGQFYFMANNVYRVSDLQPYFTDSCIYSDNAMPHVLLPLYAIKRGKIKMMMKEECLTNYTLGRASYASIWAVLRFSNILFSSLYLTGKEIRAFKKVRFFSIVNVLDCLSEINDSRLRWEYFKKIFTGHYSLLSLKGQLFLLSYLTISVTPSVWKLIRKR